MKTKPTTKEELRRFAAACGSLRAAARILGIDDHTVRRWASGESRIPAFLDLAPFWKRMVAK